MNRKFQQPRTLLPDLLHGAASQLEAMAQAETIDDLFARLESEGVLLRIDPGVSPSTFRGAIVSEAELRLLRGIQNVIRMGHVRRIERKEIALEGGCAPTDERTVHVHCAARGLPRPPLRPIFEPDRVTVQPIFLGFATYQFAMLGVIEALLESDAEKNGLCPPINYWDANEDYLAAYLALLTSTNAIGAHPKLARWNQATRLNPLSGMESHRDDPRVIASRERVRRFGRPAAVNIQRLLAKRNGG
jgi:hypothetical protein